MPKSHSVFEHSGTCRKLLRALLISGESLTPTALEWMEELAATQIVQLIQATRKPSAASIMLAEEWKRLLYDQALKQPPA